MKPSNTDLEICSNCKWYLQAFRRYQDGYCIWHAGNRNRLDFCSEFEKNTKKEENEDDKHKGKRKA